jgi:hypothetical protein
MCLEILHHKRGPAFSEYGVRCTYLIFNPNHFGIFLHLRYSEGLGQT